MGLVLRGEICAGDKVLSGHGVIRELREKGEMLACNSELSEVVCRNPEYLF